MPDLNLEAARSRSVMIGTPAHHDVAVTYAISLAGTVSLLERSGISHEIRVVVGCSHLPKARNELVAEFLASDKTDLLMVDSDMGWAPNDAVRLLASPHRLIGGVGRKKWDAPNADPNVWCATFPSGNLVQDAHGAVEVERVGTGFLRISRALAETMVAAHPEWKRQAPDGVLPHVKPFYHRIFAFADDGDRELSEDFAFCDAWRALGGRVWIDPEIDLSHIGTHDYSGRVSEIFRPAETKDAAQ